LASPSSAGSFDIAIAAVIADARAGGASDQQLAVLTEARGLGDLSTESVRESARRAVQCMADARVNATVSETTGASGLVVPGYTAALGQSAATHEEMDAAQRVVDGCDRREFSWVSSFYQTQPSSQAMTDALLARKAPELRACLERKGKLGVLDQDSTPYEIAQQASLARIETNGDVDCLTEVGIDSF
jgi:hypothetical protein